MERRADFAAASMTKTMGMPFRADNRMRSLLIAGRPRSAISLAPDASPGRRSSLRPSLGR
jgi:hypothetical protein